MQKQRIIKWKGLDIEVEYEENGYPDVILKDAHCPDNQIEFLEKVQESKDIIGELCTIIAEYWSEEYDDRFDEMEYGEQLYEMLHDK